MKIIVSACLLGRKCKYDGGDNYREDLVELLKGHEVIPVCPETAGGLPTPRIPCEIVNGVVTDREGHCRDAEFRAGAALCLEEALKAHADLAILQSRSPSCGPKEIYDGTFSGKLIPGQGIFARMLTERGIKVADIEDFKNFSAFEQR